ncbi:uracil-DNA glycosylase [Nitrospira sp.]|nr:uracil-DNA glycosylase [Nitrospira sp.]
MNAVFNRARLRAVMTTIPLLNTRIVECTLCPRLVRYRRDVASAKRKQFQNWTYWGRPVPGFGDPEARLYVLGLAPAAHGGNRTGRVFTGDRSGDWLYEALHRFSFANQPTSTDRHDGLRLCDCYIGAAVRCAPPDNKPLPAEFDACRTYVVRELALLQRTRVVVVLGKIAFDHYFKACRELGRFPSKPTPKFGHGIRYTLPWDIALLCSYHPSQQNTFTGKLTRTMFHDVFREARTLIGAYGGSRARPESAGPGRHDG